MSNKNNTSLLNTKNNIKNINLSNLKNTNNTGINNNNLNKIISNLEKTNNKESKSSNITTNNKESKSTNNNILKSLNKNNINNKNNKNNNFLKTTNNNADTKNNILDNEDFNISTIIWTLIKVALILSLLFALLYLGQYMYLRYNDYTNNSPYLLEGNKNAKHALVVSQDPNNPSYIPIKRSEDKDGLQFSYNFWFYIDNMDYKNGEWKHIFHKGNSSSYPNRCPGIWIHPTKNIIRIYMNTLENILEFIDIDNIPIRKWVNMSIIVNNTNLNIYINEFLKARKELQSIVKQNNDDFWMNLYGGFEGFLSNIRYFPYALNYDTINKILNDGPSKLKCMDTMEFSPNLHENWYST